MGVLASNLGFPRMGVHRELKKSLESYWAGRASAVELEETAAGLRERHWRLQAGFGIDHVPSGDFSLYDHVLDTAVTLGVVPERYQVGPGPSSLDRYFAMARGGALGGRSVTALEMTKWFDTNYHYLVPELSAGQRFALSSTRPVDELRQAAALGIATRPVAARPNVVPDVVEVLRYARVKPGPATRAVRGLCRAAHVPPRSGRELGAGRRAGPGARP